MFDNMGYIYMTVGLMLDINSAETNGVSYRPFYKTLVYLIHNISMLYYNKLPFIFKSIWLFNYWMNIFFHTLLALIVILMFFHNELSTISYVKLVIPIFCNNALSRNYFPQIALLTSFQIDKFYFIIRLIFTIQY